MMRIRCAPSAWRMASSRARAVERASSRLAMLAQAISSTSATIAIRIFNGWEYSRRRSEMPFAILFNCTCARARLARFSWVSLASGKLCRICRKQNIDVGRGLRHGHAGLQPAKDVERFGKVRLCICPNREE